MQDTTAASPAQSADVLGPLTTVHFGILVVLAILTILGIAYGMKLARSRRQGTRDLEEAGHLERLGDAPVDDAVAAPVTERVASRDVDTTKMPDVAPPPPVVMPVVPEPAPVAATEPGATDLTLLKGLGPKVAAMLVDLGIADIAALARLDTAQAESVAAQLGTFAPRMARDRWVEQARFLAAGDRAGFEAVFGKL